LRAVIPSILGISTSSVTTSGLSCATLLRAKYPSIAVAITSISSSRSRSFEISFLISAESSTTSTRIFRLLSCIRHPPLSLSSLVSDRSSKQGLPVHDQDNLAVAKHRGASHRLVLHPTAIQRFDHKFLLANQGVRHHPVFPIAYRNDDDEESLPPGSQPRPAAGQTPALEAEHHAGPYDRDKPVAKPVVLHAIQKRHFGCLRPRDFADREKR